jgi:AcrR family transcriptional regulator
MSARASEETRDKILRAAFEEVHERGFQGAGLSQIVGRARITKGGLFHHFESKQDLGYAIVDEILFGSIKANWIDRLEGSTDPIRDIQAILRDTVESCASKPEMLRLGCPLNNLAQEMSPLDEGFRSRIERIYAEWRGAIERAFEVGLRRGTVRKGVRPKSVAAFLVSSHAGIVGTAKNARSVDLMKLSLQAVRDYLEALKP